MSLADKAMVVTLSVSCWTARKQDKKVAEEVEAKHNARDAGRYNKLLIDKQHLDLLARRDFKKLAAAPGADDAGPLDLLS